MSISLSESWTSSTTRASSCLGLGTKDIGIFSSLSTAIANCLSPAAGDLIRPMFLVTSYASLLLWTSLALACLLVIWRACLRHLISSTFFMASTVFCHKSRSYLMGTWRRFSNSNDGSTAKSLPVDLRKALVHPVLRGFFFFLNALRHFDRQNLKIYLKV